MRKGGYGKEDKTVEEEERKETALAFRNREVERLNYPLIIRFIDYKRSSDSANCVARNSTRMRSSRSIREFTPPLSLVALLLARGSPV